MLNSEETKIKDVIGNLSEHIIMNNFLLAHKYGKLTIEEFNKCLLSLQKELSIKREEELDKFIIE